MAACPRRFIRARTSTACQEAGASSSGIRLFFLTRPPIPTLIRCSAEEDREDYTVRIQQRLGIDVRDYRVLNIHRIGVDAPVSYVFDEILAWDGETPAWPNRIATVEQMDARREHIRIVLLGGLKQLFGNGKLFAHGLGTLFKLEAVRVKRVPDAEEMDNARYLLFDCHGGYPIGIFSIYARSSTAAQGETDATQVFMVDGFNFYGVRWWPGVRVFNRLWEAVHNRVTNNVLNRFKQLCETRFLNVTAGREPTISRG
jgi:hypothetical protein